MTHRPTRLLAAAALLTLACACGMASTSTPITGDAQIRRDEAYCTQPGLRSASRQSFLVLDQNALAQASTVDDFVAKNKDVRDTLQSFGNPERATEAGFVDWRERLSLFLAPADGGAARLLFTGCVPALSPAERAAAESHQSTLDQFFGGGVASKIADAQKNFWGLFSTALLQAAVDAPAVPRSEHGPLADGTLVRSLRESGRMFHGENGVPRIIVLSNLADIDLGAAKSRADAPWTKWIPF